MKLVKLTRLHSVKDTYINPLSIDSVYTEHAEWYVLLRSNVIYDITEQCALELLKDNRK